MSGKLEKEGKWEERVGVGGGPTRSIPHMLVFLSLSLSSIWIVWVLERESACAKLKTCWPKLQLFLSI